MGGAAVLRAIAAHGVKPDAIIIEATFDSLLNTGKSRFRAMGLPGSPFAELLLFWGSVQNGFNMFSHNPVDYARAVKHPALILHGEQDARTTIDQARSIALAMGAHARFIAYAGVSHICQSSKRGQRGLDSGRGDVFGTDSLMWNSILPSFPLLAGIQASSECEEEFRTRQSGDNCRQEIRTRIYSTMKKIV